MKINKPKRPNKLRVSRPLTSGQVHEFTRMVSVITPATAVNTYGVVTWALNQLPGYTDFTTLFDLYKITSVDVQFFMSPISNHVVQTSTAGANTCIPMLYTVLDYDDSTPLASIDEALECETCLVHRADEIPVRHVAPRMAVAAYSGAFTSYTNLGQQWIDCNSPGVIHYGLKYIFRCANYLAGGTDIGEVQIISRVHIQCKNAI